MMGRGYWLHPGTQESWLVHRHETWVLENPSRIPADVHAYLLRLDPHKAMDEIRLAAINAGLIRLRDYSRNWSVQFAADDLNEKGFLRAVALFLDEIVVFKEIYFFCQFPVV